ncbi:hypothetical protein NI456_11615 [Brevundimonas diminuta]|nr:MULTISPECIES: hypothetical protein [Brevundimonas]MCO8019504.1 hypothetical protein [Brevundimonas diminuta]MCO8022586.1 hypothetical protein [Brevundimonas diminuta]
MSIFSLLERLLRGQISQNIDDILRANGGTSALLTARTPGTRDHALVKAEQDGLVVRTARLGRIDLVRYGTLFDFRLTAEGEAARRRLISGDLKSR